MIVGEQPGDIEDVRGKPFVGPSGKLLRSILAGLSVNPDDNQALISMSAINLRRPVI